MSFVAGGVESMTRAPYSVPKNAIGFGPSGNVTAWDTTLGWRYPNPQLAARFPLEAMGETAENIYELSCTGEIAGGEISREAAGSLRPAKSAARNQGYQLRILPARDRAGVYPTAQGRADPRRH